MWNMKPENKIDTFSYWFIREKDTQIFDVIRISDNTNLGKFNPCACTPLENDEISPKILADIQTNFYRYVKERPEYLLGCKEIPEDIANIDLYEMLFYASLTSKIEKIAKKDDILPRFEQCIDWLRSTDFYQAPASTRYHDSVPGGLLAHTLKVYYNLVDLFSVSKFEDVNIGSAVLVALVHDWCKIGRYEKFMRNVKNEQTGVWEKVPSYRMKPDPMINLGHGVSSVFLAQRFFNLTIEETAAIRWHMGEYNVAHNEMNELHDCNHAFPLCYMIQFADRLACTKY